MRKRAVTLDYLGRLGVGSAEQITAASNSLPVVLKSDRLPIQFTS